MVVTAFVLPAQAAAVVHLQWLLILRSKLPFPLFIHPDPEVTRISYWEITPMPLWEELQNPVDLDAPGTSKICRSGQPIVRRARWQAPLVLPQRKGVWPALEGQPSPCLFYSVLPGP